MLIIIIKQNHKTEENIRPKNVILFPILSSLPLTECRKAVEHRPQYERHSVIKFSCIDLGRQKTNN